MRAAILAIFSIFATLCSADEASPTAQLKSEIPPAFTPNTESFDYIRRTEMIPMRDGVKLYTVILIPRGAQHAPILLSRTPYDADERIGQVSSKHLSALLGNKDVVDDYESWLAAGSAGEMARQRGLDQVGFYQEFLAHPAYDDFWQEQALDKLLAKEPVSVPVMLVHSLWDQEDIYGAPHVFRAIKPKDPDNSKVFLVMGPWFHHQQRLQGDAIGDIRFSQDTAAYFRHVLVRQFFDHFLKDDAPPADLAPVTAFETGASQATAPIGPSPLAARVARRIRSRFIFSRAENSDSLRRPRPHPVSKNMSRIQPSQCLSCGDQSISRAIADSMIGKLGW
jgi:predicted acyl esterase